MNVTISETRTVKETKVVDVEQPVKRTVELTEAEFQALAFFFSKGVRAIQREISIEPYRHGGNRVGITGGPADNWHIGVNDGQTSYGLLRLRDNFLKAAEAK